MEKESTSFVTWVTSAWRKTSMKDKTRQLPRAIIRGSFAPENKEGQICHCLCKARSEIRFVRAIDQNKPSSLGTATTAVALFGVIRWANANLTLHTPLSRTRSDNSWIFEHPADSADRFLTCGFRRCAPRRLIRATFKPALKIFVEILYAGKISNCVCICVSLLHVLEGTQLFSRDNFHRYIYIICTNSDSYLSFDNESITTLISLLVCKLHRK